MSGGGLPEWIGSSTRRRHTKIIPMHQQSTRKTSLHISDDTASTFRDWGCCSLLFIRHFLCNDSKLQQPQSWKLDAVSSLICRLVFRVDCWCMRTIFVWRHRVDESIHCGSPLTDILLYFMTSELDQIFVVDYSLFITHIVCQNLSCSTMH